MYRDIISDLFKWLNQNDRKPIVLRGARQVGKTWLIREFAKLTNKKLVELNFERHPEYREIFKEKSPESVLINIERVLNTRIDKSSSILFLDEVQSAPEILANLRWFYEEIPELPVIATGSLLDFILDDHKFSMPVGRISYYFLEPMTFNEFLKAKGEEQLLDLISNLNLEDKVPDMIHQKLMKYFRYYLVIGGMPAIVKEWIQSNSIFSCIHIQQDLLNTYIDDFNKYANRVPIERLRKIISAVPSLLGKKFKYSNVDKTERAEQMKKALDMLCLARVCHIVSCIGANGLPLSAEIREKVFKVIFLDCGLASAQSGLISRTDSDIDEIIRVNEGGISEQVVGQLLKTIEPRFVNTRLFYYLREKTGAEAEIDYLITHQSNIIPIEVKSGSTGAMKSLHQFMAEKKLKLAIRINTEALNLTDINFNTTTGLRAKYKLLSIPFYLCCEIHRLLDL